MANLTSLNTSFKPITRKKKRREVALKLTSMIDMFTILLVFLLKNFSVEGQIMSVAPDLNLPESTAQKLPITTSIIAITEESLMFDGRKVTTVDKVIKGTDLIIPELLAELQQIKKLSERVGEINTEMGFTGKISIQGDRELPYLVIKKIMYTCGKVGYNDMLLATIKPE
ncbi:MAG: ExbD/TolR family protein [Candidatus Zhuqueibacterota bacterium]